MELNVLIYYYFYYCLPSVFFLIHFTQAVHFSSRGAMSVVWGRSFSETEL